MTGRQSDYAVPTGEFIAEWLEDHQVTQGQLAAAMGVSRKHVNRVIAGAPLSPDLATKLELVTRVPAKRWLALEAVYRADLERLGLVAELAKRNDLVNQFSNVAKALRAEGVVTVNKRRPGELLLQIMAFFGAGSVDVLETRIKQPCAAFRQSMAHNIDWPAVAAWLRMGELEAEDWARSLVPFQAATLRALVPSIRARTVYVGDDFGARLQQDLATAGVALVFVPEIVGSRAYGATQWMGGRPIIQLSLRGKNDGTFWFTLFHEIGHTLQHPGALFIDGLDGRSDAEDEADRFASDVLIPPSEAWRLQSLRSLDDVKRFASEIGVAPGVVVGRLHHDKKWLHKNGQGLLKRITFKQDP